MGARQRQRPARARFVCQSAALASVLACLPLGRSVLAGKQPWREDVVGASMVDRAGVRRKRGRGRAPEHEP